MQKIVVCVVCCFAPLIAQGSIVTTVQGNCTTYSSTGVLLDAQTFPNACLGTVPLAFALPQGGVNNMFFALDSRVRVFNADTTTGNHYLASFSAVSTLDEWLVVTGGSGAGVIKGSGYNYVYICCSLRGPTASAFLQDFGGGTFNGNGSTQGGDFAIPFLFGVPFHIRETISLSYTGDLTGLSVPGLSAFSDAEGNFLMTVNAIYDTQNNVIPNAQISIAPEPATWMLLLTSAALALLRVSGTAPRSTRGSC